jgi:hypothetical protein
VYVCVVFVLFVNLLQQVEVLKKELAANEQHTQARKGDIEQELSSIQPILDSAKQVML